ncbi:hypothetical protein HMSSN036_62540 [Paenibacillus macerans]|nr:hypothetical protein HMSSN036_62540 [Paenibacillus macerans]
MLTGSFEEWTMILAETRYPSAPVRIYVPISSPLVRQLAGHKKPKKNNMSMPTYHFLGFACRSVTILSKIKSSIKQLEYHVNAFIEGGNGRGGDISIHCSAVFENLQIRPLED